MVSDREIDDSCQLSSFCFEHVNNSLANYSRLAIATDWFNKGHAVCYHVYVIMHVKDPQISEV